MGNTLSKAQAEFVFKHIITEEVPCVQLWLTCVGKWLLTSDLEYCCPCVQAEQRIRTENILVNSEYNVVDGKKERKAEGRKEMGGWLQVVEQQFKMAAARAS